jgi:hypothetical protein
MKRLPSLVLALAALALFGATILVQGAQADGPLTRRAVVPLIANDEGPAPTAVPLATATPTRTTAAATSTPTATSTATPTPTTAPAPTATPTQQSSGGRTGAVCNDGTTSSATGSGACSHHGGVAYWTY